MTQLVGNTEECCLDSKESSPSAAIQNVVAIPYAVVWIIHTFDDKPGEFGRGIDVREDGDGYSADSYVR